MKPKRIVVKNSDENSGPKKSSKKKSKEPEKPDKPNKSKGSKSTNQPQTAISSNLSFRQDTGSVDSRGDSFIPSTSVSLNDSSSRADTTYRSLIIGTTSDITRSPATVVADNITNPIQIVDSGITAAVVVADDTSARVAADDAVSRASAVDSEVTTAAITDTTLNLWRAPAPTTVVTATEPAPTVVDNQTNPEPAPAVVKAAVVADDASARVATDNAVNLWATPATVVTNSAPTEVVIADTADTAVDFGVKAAVVADDASARIATDDAVSRTSAVDSQVTTATITNTTLNLWRAPAAATVIVDDTPATDADTVVANPVSTVVIADTDAASRALTVDSEVTTADTDQTTALPIWIEGGGEIVDQAIDESIIVDTEVGRDVAANPDPTAVVIVTDTTTNLISTTESTEEIRLLYSPKPGATVDLGLLTGRNINSAELISEDSEENSTEDLDPNLNTPTYRLTYQYIPFRSMDVVGDEVAELEWWINFFTGLGIEIPENPEELRALIQYYMRQSLSIGLSNVADLIIADKSQEEHIPIRTIEPPVSLTQVPINHSVSGSED